MRFDTSWACPEVFHFVSFLDNINCMKPYEYESVFSKEPQQKHMGFREQKLLAALRMNNPQFFAISARDNPDWSLDSNNIEYVLDLIRTGRITEEHIMELVNNIKVSEELDKAQESGNYIALWKNFESKTEGLRKQYKTFLTFGAYKNHYDKKFSKEEDDQVRLINELLEDRDKIDQEACKEFFNKYPTANQAREVADVFLEKLSGRVEEVKLKQYETSLEEFLNDIYGSQYTYTKIAKQILKSYGPKEGQLPVSPEKEDLPGGAFIKNPVESPYKSTGLNGPIAACSDIGGMSKYKENQDRTVLNLRQNGFGVIDGVGGREDGEKMAEIAGRGINEWLEGNKDSVTALTDAALSMEYYGSEPPAACMIGVKIENGTLNYIQAGDVKLVVYNREGGVLYESVDEVDEVGAVTNAIIAGENPELTRKSIRLQIGDTIVVASDGLYKFLGEAYPGDSLKVIGDSVSALKDPSKILTSIGRLAKDEMEAYSQQRGRDLGDNISIVVYRIEQI